MSKNQTCYYIHKLIISMLYFDFYITACSHKGISTIRENIWVVISFVQ